MTVNHDIENKDFWKKCIKKSVAKRMIKRNHTYPKLIEDVCNLSGDEVNRLLELNRSYIIQYDRQRREEYLSYFIDHKYEDEECRSILDLNRADLYEICEGRTQSLRLDLENMAEETMICRGKKIVKYLAIVKMVDLGYSTEDISKIFDNTEINSMYDYVIMISSEVIEKMKNHFINIGIKEMQMEILIKLLTLENNIENASKITALSIDRINEIIQDNDKTILDGNKLKEELGLWDLEILIEVLVIDGIHSDEISDFIQLSGLDKKDFKKIYDCHKKFRDEFSDFYSRVLKDLAGRNFDYSEIEEISGLNMYTRGYDDYYFTKFEQYLSKERYELIE